jgi:hypothetical protein
MNQESDRVQPSAKIRCDGLIREIMISTFPTSKLASEPRADEGFKALAEPCLCRGSQTGQPSSWVSSFLKDASSNASGDNTAIVIQLVASSLASPSPVHRRRLLKNVFVLALSGL